MLHPRAGVGLVAAAAALATAAPASAADRAYELVSPAAKHGNDVQAGSRATADGSAVAYTTSAPVPGQPGVVFANRAYVARRTPDGWRTTSISPPIRRAAPVVVDASFPSDLSNDLTTFYGGWFARLAEGDTTDFSGDVYVGDATSAQWLSGPSGLVDWDAFQGSAYTGRSTDGRVVVFDSEKPLATGGSAWTRNVYAWSGGAIRLVSVLPDGTPAPNATTGSGVAWDDPGGEGGSPAEHAVSADGKRIAFTTMDAPAQVYLWEEGRPTRPLSWSQAAGPGNGQPAPTGARFHSLSADGSTVYLSSPDQLTDEATAGGGLYRYDVETGKLTFVSTGASGAVNFEDVVAASRDGRRVAFVARGALTPDATDDRYNLYVAGPEGLGFVMELPGDDGNLWRTEGERVHPAKFSPDGSRLLFLSAADVAGYPTPGFKPQVYEYDAGADDLVCLSCHQDGSPTTGEGSIVDRWPGMGPSLYLNPRSYTDDGAQVLFETDEPLTADDTDEKFDVYSWDGDAARLLTPGTAEDAHYIDNSGDGSTVFFRTASSLVPQDTDPGYIDVYALRPGGGFPVAGKPERCQGEACHGPRSAAPNAPGAASASHAGPGNPPVPADPPAATAPRLVTAKLSKTALARWARTGRVRVKVTLGAAGRVRVVASATIGGKRMTVATGSATLRKAGTASVTLRLSAKARRTLRGRGRLSVRLSATSTATSRRSTATVVLRTHEKASR